MGNEELEPEVIDRCYSREMTLESTRIVIIAGVGYTLPYIKLTCNGEGFTCGPTEFEGFLEQCREVLAKLDNTRMEQIL